jgi:hypothetical protein
MGKKQTPEHLNQSILFEVRLMVAQDRMFCEEHRDQEIDNLHSEIIEAFEASGIRILGFDAEHLIITKKGRGK